jgi:hypothetical protein
MRNFDDRSGIPWTAYVVERPGSDYKGRFQLVLRRSAGSGEEVPLDDVRWNSERTARRTLETMSVVELRRRLRSALGRASLVASL